MNKHIFIHHLTRFYLKHYTFVITSLDAATRYVLVKAEIDDILRKKFRWFPRYPYPYTYPLEISTSLVYLLGVNKKQYSNGKC